MAANQIPLAVLEKRLVKLARIVTARRGAKASGRTTKKTGKKGAKKSSRKR